MILSSLGDGFEEHFVRVPLMHPGVIGERLNSESMSVGGRETLWTHSGKPK